MTRKQTRLIVGIAWVLCLCGMAAGAQEKKANHAKGKATVDKVASEVKTKRAALHKKWKQSKGEKRQAVEVETRRFIEKTLRDDIIPAWYGMPWTMAVIKDGLKPNAAYPGEPGRGTSCSWFVVSVLRNAGFRFVSANQFAGTIAVHFQKSTTPNKKHFHRVVGKTPKELKKKFLKWGDGFYIIGLNCHIGFVDVNNGKVDFVHSNYMSPWEVVREPLTKSDAILASQDAGYVVSALLHDNYLIHHWLGNTKIPFKGPKKK